MSGIGGFGGRNTQGIDRGPIKRVISKWGEQVDVDTADAALGQVIWTIKATVQAYLFLDAAIPLFIKSSSAGDNPTGTGAQSVALKNWHDANGEDADAIVLPTNGLAQTPLPQNSYGVFSFEVESTGSSNTNEGTIDIIDGSNNIYAQILPGEGRTQIAVQRVPAGKTAEINRYTVSYARASGNTGAVMRLRKRKTDGTIITLWDPSLTTSKTDDENDFPVGFGEILQPGEFIFWECTGVTSDNTPLRGTFVLNYRDN
jgi:hypothetical protein